MSTRTMLNEEIQSEIEVISKLAVGSDDYKVATDGVGKLIDKYIDLEKLEMERENKYIDREFDQEYKISQAKAEKIDRIVKNCITVIGIGAPLIVTIWGAKKTFIFEETGSIISTTGKGFINRFFKK